MPRGRRRAGWELIEHTADVGLHVWAPDVGGLFAEAALGLVGVMGKGTGPLVHREIVSLDAADAEALLVDWLSEVVYLFEGRGVVTRQVECEVETGPWRLRATVEGSDAGEFRESGPGVKAVTYHRISVGPADGGWEARVYLDV